MKIKTEDLKRFFSLASSVKSSAILPICDFIFLSEHGKLTKTNMRTFIVHAISEGEYEPVLLNEKIVSEIVKKTKDDVLNVEIIGMNVLVSDSQNKIKFPYSDPSSFPTFPEHEKDQEYDFDTELLESIGIASKNTSQSKDGEKLEYVHFENGYVFASDRSKFYFKKFPNLPELVLDSETCEVVSRLNHVRFFQKGNYNFFETPNTLYGFIQTTANKVDFQKLIPVKNEKDYFELKVSDLLDFCELVLSLGNEKVRICKMKGTKLSYSEDAYNLSIDRTMDGSGTCEPELQFNPYHLTPFIRSIGIDTLIFCPFTVANSYSVWDKDDPLFSGVVAGIKL